MAGGELNYTPTGYDSGAQSEQQSAVEMIRRMQEQQRQQQQQQQGGGLGGIAGGTYLASKFPSLFGGGATTAAPGIPATTSIGSLAPEIPYSLGGGETVAGGTIFGPGGEAIANANPGAFVEGPGMMSPTAGPGTFGMIAGPALIGHGAYQIGRDWGRSNPGRGALAGGEMGAGAALLGATPWAIPALAAAGGLAGMVTSGKHKDQYARDEVRAAMKEKGIIDENYGLELYDGTKFNIGLDGGARPEYSFSGGRRPYEVNAENQFSGQAVGWANPLAYILTGGDRKLSTDYAGYFANASMSNAQTIEGVRANMLKFMENMKLTPEMATQQIDQLLSAGKISEQEAAAFRNGLGTLIAGDPKQYVMQSVAEMEQSTPAPTPEVATPAPQPTDPNLDAMPSEPVARPMAKQIRSFADAKYSGKH